MHCTDGNLGPHTEVGVWLSCAQHSQPREAEMSHETRAALCEGRTALKMPWGGHWGWAGPQTEQGVLATLLLQAAAQELLEDKGKTFILKTCIAVLSVCSHMLNRTCALTPPQLLQLKSQNYGIIQVGKDLLVTGSQHH